MLHRSDQYTHESPKKQSFAVYIKKYQKEILDRFYPHK